MTLKNETKMSNFMGIILKKELWQMFDFEI